MKFSTNVHKFVRKYCTSQLPKEFYSLVGRKYIAPTDLSENEMKSLLWTALEMKMISANEIDKIAELQNKTIMFLLSKPSIYIQNAIMNAATHLGLSVNTVVEPTWELCKYPQDIGKILGKTSDLIFLENNFQSKASLFSSGSDAPVVCVQTRKFVMVQALADLLTLQETFGFLEQLSVSWVGSTSPLINTYLYMIPKLGMSMKYYCACKRDEQMSPALLNTAKDQVHTFEKCIHESKTLEDALDKSQLVVIGSHQDKRMQINTNCEKWAAKNFYIMHCIPRGSIEIDSEIFESPRNLTWSSYQNMQWIFSALITRMLMEYKHITKRPKFRK